MRKLAIITVFFFIAACSSTTVDESPLDEVPEQCDPSGEWSLDFRFDLGSCNFDTAEATVVIVKADDSFAIQLDDVTQDITAQVDQACAIHVVETIPTSHPLDVHKNATWTWTYSFWRDGGGVVGSGNLKISLPDGSLFCDQDFAVGGVVRPTS